MGKRADKRRSARNERKRIKQEGKTARVQARTSTREAVKVSAYESGQNPNSFLGDIAKSVSGAVVGAVGLKSAGKVGVEAFKSRGRVQDQETEEKETGFFAWLKSLFN